MTIMRNALTSSSMSNFAVVAVGKSSPENRNDKSIDESIAAPPPSFGVEFDGTVTASGGGSAMTIGRAMVRGINGSSFPKILRAISMRRRPSDDDDDGGSIRTMVGRTRAAAVRRVREPGRISASDWRDNILNMPNSTILQDVQDPVTWVFVWATCWSIMYECLTRLIASAAAAGGAYASPNAGSAAGYFSWWGGAVVATKPSEAGWVRLSSWASRRMCLPTLDNYPGLVKPKKFDGEPAR